MNEIKIKLFEEVPHIPDYCGNYHVHMEWDDIHPPKDEDAIYNAGVIAVIVIVLLMFAIGTIAIIVYACLEYKKRKEKF